MPLSYFIKYNVLILGIPIYWLGFPGPAGKETTCNAGDHGLISGSGRSPAEVIGYPLQYSWASMVAQMVRNLPAMWETWIWSLDWEDSLEKVKATPPVFWPGEFHGQSMGLQRVRHDWATFTSLWIEVNMQGDYTAFTYSFPYLEPVCCSMSGSNCCFWICIQISQEAGQVVWYSHLLKNFPQFVVIHTVKAFSSVQSLSHVWLFATP